MANTYGKMFPPSDVRGKGIQQDVKVCFITNEKIKAGDVKFVIPGTPLFVRLKAGVAAKLTDEQRQQVIDQVKAAAHWVDPEPDVVDGSADEQAEDEANG